MGRPSDSKAPFGHCSVSVCLVYTWVRGRCCPVDMWVQGCSGSVVTYTDTHTILAKEEEIALDGA